MLSYLHLFVSFKNMFLILFYEIILQIIFKDNISYYKLSLQKDRLTFFFHDHGDIRWDTLFYCNDSYL